MREIQTDTDSNEQEAYGGELGARGDGEIRSERQREGEWLFFSGDPDAAELDAACVCVCFSVCVCVCV